VKSSAPRPKARESPRRSDAHHDGVAHERLSPRVGRLRCAKDAIGSRVERGRVPGSVGDRQLDRRGETSRSTRSLWGVRVRRSALESRRSRRGSVWRLVGRTVDTYSGGQRRRLEIARALVSRPRVGASSVSRPYIFPMSRSAVFTRGARVNPPGGDLTVGPSGRTLRPRDQRPRDSRRRRWAPAVRVTVATDQIARPNRIATSATPVTHSAAGTPRTRPRNARGFAPGQAAVDDGILEHDRARRALHDRVLRDIAAGDPREAARGRHRRGEASDRRGLSRAIGPRGGRRLHPARRRTSHPSRPSTPPG